MNGGPDSAWAGLPLGRGVTVLSADPNGVGALFKPAGVLSHPNSARDQPRSLLDAPYHLEGEYYEWASGRLWLANRLDSATSGVILAASEAALAETVRAQLKLRKVRKIYRALVFGKPRLPAETWRDRLAVARQEGRIRTGSGLMPAECDMTVIRSGDGVSLLGLEPHTGRTHQLRVQCARRGLPIVGDQTYGDFRRNREFARAAGSKRLFLHSLSTSFDYPHGGRTFHFEAEAPLPEEFGNKI